jgi:hypothetical protein
MRGVYPKAMLVYDVDTAEKRGVFRLSLFVDIPV